MNFNTCLDPCNYLHGQDIELSHYPPSKKDSLLSSLYSHSLPDPENHLSFFFFYSLSLRKPYKWNLTACNLLRQASFNKHNAWMIHPTCVCINTSYLLLSSIPWYEWVIIINLLKIHYIFNWSLIHMQ